MVDADAEQSCQLAKVLLGYHHLFVLTQYLGGVGWQWVDELELCKCNLMAFRT